MMIISRDEFERLKKIEQYYKKECCNISNCVIVDRDEFGEIYDVWISPMSDAEEMHRNLLSRKILRLNEDLQRYQLRIQNYNKRGALYRALNKINDEL